MKNDTATHGQYVSGTSRIGGIARAGGIAVPTGPLTPQVEQATPEADAIMLDRPTARATGSDHHISEADEALWTTLVAECFGLQELIEDIKGEPDEFDIYCRIAHWYGYGDRRGRGVKERWGQVWQYSVFRDDDHAYDVGYRKLNSMLPLWCDQGCGC